MLRIFTQQQNAMESLPNIGFGVPRGRARVTWRILAGFWVREVLDCIGAGFWVPKVPKVVGVLEGWGWGGGSGWGDDNLLETCTHA